MKDDEQSSDQRDWLAITKELTIKLLAKCEKIAEMDAEDIDHLLDALWTAQSLHMRSLVMDHHIELQLRKVDSY